MERVNVAEKLASFQETWSPKVIAELNGQYVKVVKTEGEYVWHHHQGEDELFYVVKGRLDIALRDRTIELNEGEFFVVPRGVEHKPISHGPAEVLLFEPVTTRNTGNVDHDYTIEAANLERI